MASQVLGTVSEVEGQVTVMRDGEAINLAANDAIRADDVITASDTGRANIVLTNSYGEPIGNLLVSPNGSVAAHSEMIDGQAGFHFETLSADGIALTDIDPDYADLIVVEEGVAGSGGMFGLFDAGLIAGGSLGTTAAVGAGAVGIAALGSGGDDGTGPTGSGSSGDSMQDNMDSSNPDSGSDGPTGTPLDAALSPLAAQAEGTPLEPVADALAGGGDSGGGEEGGTTGTPLDAAIDPLAAQAEGTPLEPVADALAGGGESGGGEEGGTTGTPLDAAIDPLVAQAEGTPLEPVADALTGGGESGGGEEGGTTGTPLDAVIDPLAAQAEGTPIETVTDSLMTASSGSPISSSPVSADTLTGLPDTLP